MENTAHRTSGKKPVNDPSSATGEMIERLKYMETKDPSQSKLANEITIDGQPLPTRDANFATELEYEGYRSIEQYDGDEYEGNIDGDINDGKELEFNDRPRDDSITEELPTDRQDNHPIDEEEPPNLPKKSA